MSQKYLPSDFRAKLFFGALIDCYRVKLLKNYGVKCFQALEPIMWALKGPLII